LEKSLKLENAKNKTSFMLIKSFAVERGPKHFFGNHENDGTVEFFPAKGFFWKNSYGRTAKACLQ
jgi:hypothetical protein